MHRTGNLLVALILCLMLAPNGLGAPPRVATVAPAASRAGSPGQVAAEPCSAEEEKQALELFKPVENLAHDWLKRNELQHSLVGLEIMDIPSGRVLFDHNARKRFVSASIAKVFTTSCMYDTFGANYVYKTSLVGYGGIKNARLGGPLIIVPSEDPSFTDEDLRAMIGTLPSKFKFITGRVMVASMQGGGDRFLTEWLVQDWGQDWMPPSSDFVLDRNVVLGRDPGRGYPLTIATAAGETSALTRTLLQSQWAPAWCLFNKQSSTVTFYRPDVPVTGGIVVGNPTDYNTAVALMHLKTAGIKVDGHDLPAADDPIPLAEHSSKPLSSLIRFTLKESDNLYSQQFIRTLGTLAPLAKNLENAALEDRGLARLNTWLTGIGVPPGEAVLFDGCGLSRKNLISPHALNVVLRHMSGPTGNGPFTDLMIHEGEGSTKTFRYKTGSMDSVRSISGVVHTSTGHPLAVTVIVNAHTPSVRELRASLNGLISKVESLGTLKLKPVQEKVAPKHKAHPTPAGRGGSHTGRSSGHRGGKRGR